MDTLTSAPRLGSSTSRIWWLGGVSVAWMCVECGVSLYAALTASSPALLAFGADSLVELLSASLVLMQYIPGVRLSRERAERAAGSLLFLLAGVVAAVAVLGFVFARKPEVSPVGIGITAAALLVMPALAYFKRREGRRIGDGAMIADAAQSSTCAYLAFTALAGLVLHAWLGVAGFDSLAALAAVPLIVREARAARRGQGCHCCG